jgi:tetratricopeptide (TPR) repeat protein
MKCERVEELLIDYLAGEIEPSENRLVENHLQRCHNCSTKFTEFKEIRSAFQSEILPEPSQEVLETLTIKAKQDLNKEKLSFWKKWFYTPVLIPTLTTAIALMIWVDYKDSNKAQFDDNAEFYSREVMAEKVPSGKYTEKDIALEGSGRTQVKEDSSGFKQNVKSFITDRAVGERRRDVASAPSVSTVDLPQAQIRSGNDELSATAGGSSDTPGPSNVGADNRIESYRDFENYESESARLGLSSPSRGVVSEAEVESKFLDKGKSEPVAADLLKKSELAQIKPESPSEDTKKDEDSFRFSIGSKVMAKKMPRSSGDLQEEEVDINQTGDYRELPAETELIISEQVRSEEKQSQISKERLEDARFREIDSPKEISDKAYLRQLNVALKQQKAGDCESAIITNENNLKNIPTAPDEIKEQTYLSLAQCYEQQNMYVKAIENYNYLQRVAPGQKAFATEKIQELNFKVQNLKSTDTLSEPSTSSETGVEAVK